MKTELRAVPHFSIPGATVFEAWYDGEFIGTVYGADGPGVRIVSRCEMKVKPGPHVVEVEIDAQRHV